MTDDDSDEPIGRRGPASRSRSSRNSGGGGTSSRKKASTSSRSKAKRKIISSDEENDEHAAPVRSSGGHNSPPTDRGRDRDLKERSRQDRDKMKDPKTSIDGEVNIDARNPPEPPSLSPILGSSLDGVGASFSPVLSKGPPSPRHQQQSLCWKHRVNLIGEKVVDPMIHICDKCHLPILIYARMIPCKHVFCLECGRAADKVCYKCGDKVTRVEQTTLGKVFMCTHQQGKTREPCKRTYLSQRDLQAHIAHRHIKAKEKQQVPSAAVSRDPRHVMHRSHTQTFPSGTAVHQTSPAGHSAAAAQTAAAIAAAQAAAAVAAGLSCTGASLVSAGPALGSKVASPYANPTGAPPTPSLTAPPLPAIAAGVPPPVPSAASPYLTPPPVYAPQMVPPPTAVYATATASHAQYPPVGVPVGVGPVPPPPPPPAVPTFVHAPPPPPPTAYAAPTPYDDYGRAAAAVAAAGVVAMPHTHGHSTHGGHGHQAPPAHSGHTSRAPPPPWQQRAPPPPQPPPPPPSHRDYRGPPTGAQPQHYYR